MTIPTTTPTDPAPLPAAETSHPGTSKSTAGRRVAVGCFSIVVLVAALLFGILKMLDQPRPEGIAGAEATAEADRLAQRMMRAVDVEAWRRTGAVTWNFSDRQRHLWDRQRQFARVRFDGNEVLLDLASLRGVASRHGEPAKGPERTALLEAAWEHWVNDSFWLNPVAKLLDPGTERELVALDPGQDEATAPRGLLVTYTSGGVTPGDAYLWIVGDDDLPVAWRMWTEILPVGGIDASWEGWITLDTGARVATRHQTPIFQLELTEVRGAETLDALLKPGAEDPFAPLVTLLATPIEG